MNYLFKNTLNIFYKKTSKIFILSVTSILIVTNHLHAQEYTAPICSNVKLSIEKEKRTASKPTSLSLPFFDDFTNKGPYPDEHKWVGNSAWVNNSMGLNPLSRGVATLDALNAQGKPYDTLDMYNTLVADSLTSSPIDLSNHSIGDSLYLSFFYQAGGYGFPPKGQDSLIVFLHLSNGVWQQVWAIPGDTATRWQHAMIPITLPTAFYDNFEFRIVNKATLGISNSQWNIDYVRLAANRTFDDIEFDDIAYTKQPSSILNDFTQMPYKHFATSPNSFLKTELTATIQNNGFSLSDVSYGYTSRIIGGTTLGSASSNLGGFPYRTPTDIHFPMYNINTTANNFIIENKFYLTDIYPDAPLENDTIIQQQVFGNAFAYDDGTAEKSYFLSLNDNVPGKIAIEYAFYTPDTLRGVAIQFAPQVPSAYNKQFSLVVYRDIAVNGGSDDIIYQQDYQYPRYEDSLSQLTVFPFDQAIPINTGVFYIGIVFPSGGFSDSVMIALDVNRTNGNHRYYSVFNQWNTSLLDGALLVRPLVGAPLPLNISPNEINNTVKWDIYPNPADDNITINMASMGNTRYRYVLYNSIGERIKEATIISRLTNLNIKNIPSGLYYIRLSNDKGEEDFKKFVKK